MTGPERADDVTARNLPQRLLLGGGVAVMIGIMALGLAVVLAAKSGAAPVALLLVGLLCPIGLAVAFGGLVAQARRREP